MAYLILLLFALLVLIAYLEESIPEQYNRAMFAFFCVSLILIAGLREVGLDVDSENYEKTFLYYYDDNVASSMEFSFILLSRILNLFTRDVHSIFLLYAAFGVTLKFLAFRKYSTSYFLPIMVYISFFFELHEMMQIRTGIISAVFLLAVRPIAERKVVVSVLAIGIAALFHISAIMFLPLLLLGNKPLKGFWLWAWMSVVPMAYLLTAAMNNVTLIVHIPYIGDKLALYQATAQLGIFKTSVNIYNPLLLFHIFVFYYLLYFQDTIMEENKYFPYMMKIFALAIAAFIFFSFLPVLSERIGYLLRIIVVLLIPNIVYTIRPRWVGITVVAIITFLFLNYGLTYIGFEFLWNVA